MASFVGGAISPAMMLDLPAIRRALQFVPANTTAVLAASCVYAVMFALQSYFTATAGAGDVGGAPIALGFGAVAFFAFVLAMASWGRIALDKPHGPYLGMALGGDEGRLTWTAFLILVLTVTVLGTAFLAVAFMIAALALINVDPEAPAPDAGQVDLFGLFGTGEWIVSAVIFAAFGVFALWFFLRLAMAYPATLDAGRIQIMSVWPLSGKGRAVRILTTVVAAALPGILVLVLFNGVSATVFGAYPAAAQSASAEAGQLTLAPALFIAMSFLYGVLKAALVGAPVCAALCTLYRDLQTAPRTPGF